MAGLGEVLGAVEEAWAAHVFAAEASLWNSLGLTLRAWAVGVAVVVCGVSLLDPVALGVARLLRVAKLPSREPVPIMKGLEELSRKDLCFLAVNQLVQTWGMMHFAQFAFAQAGVVRAAEGASLGNTIGAAYAIFLLDDFFYYWCHRILHLPSVYPWVHKHHHRQALPSRGYWDAANEHPLEQVIGLSCVILTLRVVLQLWPPGVHVIGVAAFVMIYALCATLNHVEYDVRFPLLLGYAVRAHEMHHRIPQCNYAQNTMMWDRLFGTFNEYKSGQPEPADKASKKRS
jgi:sterol desaturase/sphingolipid hydroxylase (fatty acid hydroxylase superfamily)